MKEVNLKPILKDTIESYILFREIEDWCLANVPRDKWHFCSTQICVYGVDLPGRIIFTHEKDITVFRVRFGIA
jgi:hypothetical protein